MKDVAGYDIEKGNLVQVMLGQQPLVGYVHDLEEGGLAIAGPQNAVIPPKLFIIFEINLTDAPPGGNHILLRRLPDPKSEVIIKAKGQN